MTMTVGELREMLEDLDDDMEVRMATQPSWPFEYSISKVMTPDEIEAEGECESCGLYSGVHEDDCDRNDDDKPNCVYLAEGSQLGYLAGQVSRSLGWR